MIDIRPSTLPTPCPPPRAALRLLVLLVAAAAPAGCGGEEPAGPSTAPARAPVETVAPAPRPTEPPAPGTSCVNSACHASFTGARSVHGVVRMRDGCSICHEPDRGGHVFPVKQPGNEGCTACHAGVGERGLHRHAAVDVGCLECHDPHASDHGALLTASVPVLCASCHPTSHVEAPHAPYGQGACTACHEPHASDFAGLLRGGAGAEHCFVCHEATHDAIADAGNVHAPAQGDCRMCHDPHGTDFPHLLAQPIDSTCFSCHPDIERAIAGVAEPHGALALDDRCGNCHDAHASNHPHLLKDRQDRLCLACHGAAVVASDGRTIPDMTEDIRDREFLHGPVRSGDCAACHTVHGGSHSRLLRAAFTPEFYTSFDLSQYALCFQCHDPALVTEPLTDALTDFRDGDLNLHHLHVNRQEKGRTCRACHEIHGSDQPAHIAQSVPFGRSDWALPIDFERTATGGSCAPGCHQPMRYDRQAPARTAP